MGTGPPNTELNPDTIGAAIEAATTAHATALASAAITESAPVSTTDKTEKKAQQPHAEHDSVAQAVHIQYAEQQDKTADSNHVYGASTILCEQGIARPLLLREQGSFFIGEKRIKAQGTYDSGCPLCSAGQTHHFDQAYVSYQVPVHCQNLPLIFVHGAGTSSKIWESTPDGREGLATLAVRQGFSTYTIDLPRHGRAGRDCAEKAHNISPRDQFYFELYRLGLWPNFFQPSAFPRAQSSLEQFLRLLSACDAITYDESLCCHSINSLLKKLGQGILLVHAQSALGWHTGIQNPEAVKAIVAYEPFDGFVFPENEMPVPQQVPENPLGPLKATAVSHDNFEHLTHFPIIIFYGDHISCMPNEHWCQELWRRRLEMAQLFVDSINHHGGDATLVHLPKLGIYGNTHFLFSDQNNGQLATMLWQWLQEHKLACFGTEEKGQMGQRR